MLLTSKCNISCRHCCNDSGPSHSGAARFEDIARIIEMARGIPSIKEVGISGGEPFMFIPLLHRIIQFAASAGFTSSVTTNGFWGRSVRAAQLLEDLKTSGLRAVHISTSVFHQEFVDLSTVISAASTALLVGLKATINLVSTSSLSDEEIRIALGELSDKVEIIVMPCLPAGRAATLVDDEEFVCEQVTPQGNCREHFKKLAVDRSGNVYPCCSPGGFTAPLLMGNVQNASLSSILEASANNKLLAILESVGPQFFLPFLRAAAIEPPLPERFSDQCHLCHVMLSSSSYAETIRNASERLFWELATLPLTERPPRGDRVAALCLATTTESQAAENLE
jgi:MoaA/NifB/PqqE/SkfB family radical SAM enzyme